MVETDESIQLDLFESKIREYFTRMSVLRSQVPSELRQLLLLPYMTWDNFQCAFFIDPNHNFWFEVFRQSQNELKITRHNVQKGEKEVFMVYNENSSDFYFADTIRSKVTGTKMHYDETNGGVRIDPASDVRFLDLNLWFYPRRTKVRVKRLYFAWVVTASIVKDLQQIEYANQDFYDVLFYNLRRMVQKTFEPLGSTTWNKVVNFYKSLLARIQAEFESVLILTEADEQIFQKLLETYKFFLHPDAKAIYPQFVIRGAIRFKKPDFRVVLQDVVMYVEIEPPYYKPYEGIKQSRRLEGALEQINDWKQIVDEVPSEPKDKKREYLIIIGLSAQLSLEEKASLMQFNKSQTDCTVSTWDRILDKIKETKTIVETLKMEKQG